MSRQINYNISCLRSWFNLTLPRRDIRLLELAPPRAAAAVRHRVSLPGKISAASYVRAGVDSHSKSIPRRIHSKRETHRNASDSCLIIIPTVVCMLRRCVFISRDFHDFTISRYLNKKKWSCFIIIYFTKVYFFLLEKL